MKSLTSSLMMLLGVFGIEDPPRAGIPEVIERCRGAGVAEDVDQDVPVPVVGLGIVRVQGNCL